jgi:hypothetical protein
MYRSPARPKSLLEALALVGFLVSSAVGCSEAESRAAPEDGPAADAPAAEGTASGERAASPEPSSATAEPVRRTVPTGTTMSFAVQDTVSTEKNDVGDTFTATLQSNVNDVSGTQVISEGNPSRWVLTESATRDGQAVLAFQLESIQVDGQWMPVTAEVTETDLQTDDPATGGETAAKIGVGTAAGALIGQILGSDTESTLAGAGAGAAVGTVVALSTRGGRATLVPGSSITVELREPLIIS